MANGGKARENRKKGSKQGGEGEGERGDEPEGGEGGTSRPHFSRDAQSIFRTPIDMTVQTPGDCMCVRAAISAQPVCDERTPKPKLGKTSRAKRHFYRNKLVPTTPQHN